MSQRQGVQEWRKRNSILTAAERTDTVLLRMELLQSRFFSTTGWFHRGETTFNRDYSQRHYLTATARTCL